MSLPPRIVLSFAFIAALPVPLVRAQAKGTALPGLKEPSSGASGAVQREAPAAKSAAPALNVSELRKKAGDGDVSARIQLADAILSGRVKDAMPEEAVQLLEKASDSGDAQGQLAFARLLQMGGPGLKADPDRAKFLIQQAAESGSPAAQTVYAALLFSQIDPRAREVNYDEPVSWYRKAADQNFPEAQCRLGMMLSAGQAGPADPAAGWKLISKAARAGFPLALNEAGISLQQGRGVEADPIAAVGYFHAAADLGNAAAMVNLGACYRNGNGVPPDINKAGAAFATAAKANFAPAQLMLGEMFERGEGTAANPVFAAVNYLRAAANGLAAGKERFEALKPKLTAAQLKEVDAAAGKPPAPAGEAPKAR